MDDERPFRVALLASGNGSNAERIIRHFEQHPNVSISLLLSNRADAFALVRAERLGIHAGVFTREEWTGGAVLQRLRQAGITHVVLAGFLWLVPADLIREYPDRIINIHPALLPSFGGKGMYGARVHEAVKNSGATETGITIHLVNEHYDEGQVLFQASCPVTPDDTPDTIAAHVHELEYRHFPRVIEDWIFQSTSRN